jgi:hypothetical protein
MSVLSLVFGLATLAALFSVGWDPIIRTLFFVILAVYFLALLISNQQYEEDTLSKIERIAGAFLLSYLLFISLLYIPIRGFVFGQLITAQFFLSDFLALMLFILFLFLFGTVSLTLNSIARFGFLSRWRIFNNNTAYFVLRCLFLPALVIFALIQIKIYLP